jgi:hypothetical protein
MRTEGSGHSKSLSDPIGNRARDLLCCGAVRQPNAPPLVRFTMPVVEIPAGKWI